MELLEQQVRGTGRWEGVNVCVWDCHSKLGLDLVSEFDSDIFDIDVFLLLS